MVPNARRKCGTERPGGIHAHPGESCLKRDVCRDQNAGEQTGVFGKPVVIREIEHGRHHSRCDDEFGNERYPWPAWSRRRYHISHSWIRDLTPEKLGHKNNAQHRTAELRNYIEERVPELDFAETEERQCHRGIDVCARLLPPGRIEDSERCQSMDSPPSRFRRKSEETACLTGDC